MACHQTAWTNYIHICLTKPLCVNSVAPGRPGCHFKTAIFNLVLLIGFFRSSNDNAPRWMPWDLTDDKSTLVQVMAWCSRAASHYLSQCWPSSMLPYGVTRPQWVNSMALETWEFICWVSTWPWNECRRTSWQQVNIGSGNGLVSSGNKPLYEPMLGQI